MKKMFVEAFVLVVVSVSFLFLFFHFTSHRSTSGVKQSQDVPLYFSAVLFEDYYEEGVPYGLDMIEDYVVLCTSPRRVTCPYKENGGECLMISCGLDLNLNKVLDRCEVEEALFFEDA